MNRRKNVKPGEIKLYYGKLKYEDPDIVMSWGGGTANKSDAGLIMYALNNQRLFGDGKTLIEELESRGYDIASIYFYVKHK